MKNLFLLLCSLSLAIIFLEFFVSTLSLDLGMMWNYSNKVDGDFNYSNQQEILRPSSAPSLLYELVPDIQTSCSNCTHPEEKKYSKNTITINNRGLRGDEVRSIKGDIFRIIILGGSNTFGISVADEDTYPYQLQKILHANFSKKIEVLNAGLTAYTLTQNVAFMSNNFEDLNPDLIIFEDHNKGRRSFHYKDINLKEHFQKDESLYEENFPYCLTYTKNYPSLHRWFLQSSLYRLMHSSFNNIKMYTYIKKCTHNDDLDWDCIIEPFAQCFDRHANNIAERQFQTFSKKFSLVPIIRFNPTEKRYCKPFKKANIWYFSLCKLPQEDAYTDIHPPSHVYQYYAREIYRFLIKNQILSNDLRRHSL